MGLAVLRMGSKKVLGRRGQYSETARRTEKDRSREIRAETGVRRSAEMTNRAHGPGRTEVALPERGFKSVPG